MFCNAEDQLKLTMPVDGIVNAVALQFHCEYTVPVMLSAKRPIIIRLRVILDRLQRGERVTAGIMSTELNVSLRTIARDFDYLINELQVPMKYDYTMKSYVLTGEIPPMLVNPAEQVNT
jgi:hypothetical protein